MTAIFAFTGTSRDPRADGLEYRHVGELGFAYLRRAIQNFVGTGGNVAAEKKFFVTFEDGEGGALDGAARRYTLTVRDTTARRRALVADCVPASDGPALSERIDRYAVGSTTDGLVGADGNVNMILSARATRTPREPGSRFPQSPSTSISGCGSPAPKRKMGVGCHRRSLRTR